MYECHCFWVAFLVPPKNVSRSLFQRFPNFLVQTFVFFKKFGRASEPFSKKFKALQSRAFLARDQVRGFLFARANGSIKQL